MLVMSAAELLRLKDGLKPNVPLPTAPGFFMLLSYSD